MKTIHIIAILLSMPGLLSTARAELVGHWAFDGNYVDSSGGHHHGAPGGNVTVGTDNGVRGGAASFDGRRDSVTVPIAVSGSDWTVAVWARALNDGMFITSGRPEGWESLFIRRWAGTTLHAAINWPEWRRSGTGWGHYGHMDVAPIDAGAWHHVAITCRGATPSQRGSARFYVDGELVHAVEASDPGPTFPGWVGGLMTIGRSPYTSQFDYAGLVDDVRVYDEVLTGDKIRALIENPVAVAEAGLDVEDQLLLDGSRSSDADGTLVTWDWKLVNRDPAGDNFEYSGEVLSAVSVDIGVYDAYLTVTDNDGLTGSDTTVLAVPRAVPADTVPPAGSVHAYSNMLWPPNNQDVQVEISGYVYDELSALKDGGGTGIASASLEVEGVEIPITLDADGTFTGWAVVQAVKGAVYSVELFATDTSGNGPTLIDATSIVVPQAGSRGSLGR